MRVVEELWFGDLGVNALSLAAVGRGVGFRVKGSFKGSITVLGLGL